MPVAWLQILRFPDYMMVVQDCVHVATSLLPNSVFESADQVRLALVWAALAEVGTHAIAVGIFVEKHRAPPGVTGQLRFAIKHTDFMCAEEREWVCQQNSRKWAGPVKGCCSSSCLACQGRC